MWGFSNTNLTRTAPDINCLALSTVIGEILLWIFEVINPVHLCYVCILLFEYLIGRGKVRHGAMRMVRCSQVGLGKVAEPGISD